MSIGNTEELTRIEIDNRPTVISSWAAVGAAVLAALTSGLFAFLALPLSAGGVGMIAGGLFYAHNRSWVTIGTASLFLGVLVAGGFGAPIELLLISMIGTLLAWDFGQHSISLGRQVGRHSTTRRNEIIHCGASTMVACVAAAIGLAVFLTAGGGRPVAALSMLLLGFLFLLWAIRT